SCNGAKYCQVRAWAKHQNPHCKEVESIIPAPCEHGASTVLVPEFPERAGLIPDSLIPSPPMLENSVFVLEENARAREASEMPSPRWCDQRDLREFHKAREKLQLKLDNGWGSDLSDDQIFEYQCSLAGLPVWRGRELTEGGEKIA